MITAPLHVFPVVITSRDGATTDVAVLIDAVRKAYRRRQVRLPTGFDLFALAREVDRVLIKYRILVDMGRGQWNDREKRGQKLLKARSMADIASLLSRDEAGDWWLGEIYRAPGIRDLPSIQERVKRLLGERFTKKGDSNSARAVLGPGSGLEWLVRDGLPPIFRHHFGLPPRISRTTKVVGGKPKTYFYGSYLRFVQAVLVAEGVAATPGTLHAIFRR